MEQELIINSSVKAGSVAIANFDEIHNRIAEINKHYSTLSISESDLAFAKKQRANLNKLSTQLDNKRKEIKSAYLLPFEEAETKLKELVSMVKDASKAIDNQIKDYEKKDDDLKTAKIKEAFEEIFYDSEPLKQINFEAVFEDSWLAKGKSIEDIKTCLNEAKNKVISDFQVIDRAYDVQSATEMKFEYIKLFNQKDKDCCLKAINFVQEKNDFIKNVVPSQVETHTPLVYVDNKITLHLTLTATKEEFDSVAQFLKKLGVNYLFSK